MTSLSHSSEDESHSGEVEHAANMLMQAVQNLVTIPADKSTMLSSSSRRRRRKRLRTELTDQGGSYYDANESGASRRDSHVMSEPSSEMISVFSHGSQPGDSHIGGSRIDSRKRLHSDTSRGESRGNIGADVRTVQSVSPMVTTSQPTSNYQPLSVGRFQSRTGDLPQNLKDFESGSGFVEPRIGQRSRQDHANDSSAYSGGHGERLVKHSQASASSQITVPSHSAPKIASAIVSGQLAQSSGRMQQPRDFITTIQKSGSVGVDEHKRLFRFQPSKQYTKSYKGKGRGKGSTARPLRDKQSYSIWKKKSFCLADCRQTLKPTPQEKISLAKMGLETKCLDFRLEGSAHHVHSVILNEWPVLENCGGYTLLRLAENSHSLVEIEPPLSGHISVQFLKSILNNATLYIRPLQRSIEFADMQEFYSLEVSTK